MPRSTRAAGASPSSPSSWPPTSPATPTARPARRPARSAARGTSPRRVAGRAHPRRRGPSALPPVMIVGGVGPVPRGARSGTLSGAPPAARERTRRRGGPAAPPAGRGRPAPGGGRRGRRRSTERIALGLAPTPERSLPRWPRTGRELPGPSDELGWRSARRGQRPEDRLVAGGRPLAARPRAVAARSLRSGDPPVRQARSVAN